MATMALTVLSQCYNCGHSLTRPDIQLRASPFPELVGENHFLQSSQATSVEDVISKTLSDISQIDAEIVRFEGILNELRQKRDDLHTCVNTHKALIAPIGRLPTEILSDIFLRCIDTEWLNINNPPTDIWPDRNRIRLDKSPSRIASTCRRWRSIALDIPYLWSSIALIVSPEDLEADVEFTKLWVARSAESPLSICLESDGWYDGEMEVLMEIFASCCSRWKNIRLFLPPPMMEYLAPVRGRLPNLQWLSVFIDTDESNLLDTFEIAPRLRHLQLDGEVLTPSIKIPWSQLQTCDMGPQSAQDYLDMLSMMPNIESCLLDIKDSTSHNYGPASVELKKLRSMECLARSTHLVAALHLPVLEELKYTYLSHDHTHASNLISLLSRCSLRGFTFNTPHFIYPLAEDMITILQQTPKLTELTFLNSKPRWFSSGFLRRLIHIDDPNTTNLVPLLQSFSLHCDPSESELDMLLLADALQSRISPHGLKKVDITFKTFQETPELFAIVDRMRQLRDLGLEMRVSYKDRELL